MLTAAEERPRQAAERLEAVKDPAQAARERWLRDLAALRAQAASVSIAAAELSKTRVQEELADLLKNVISGVLLLIERPLRVGDLIEVDNIRGRVTSIGLRSSTVRDAKGMETLIPNSSFLERHLTNWTYSSRISRFSLRVGVPYGSSTHQVMDLLTRLAHNHPHVLKIPQPQALLEEFGAQARIFILNYWLEIRLDVDPNQVASELRFSIEQKFAEAGLKVLPAA